MGNRQCVTEEQSWAGHFSPRPALGLYLRGDGCRGLLLCWGVCERERQRQRDGDRARQGQEGGWMGADRPRPKAACSHFWPFFLNIITRSR